MTPEEVAALDYQSVLAEVRAEIARRQLSGQQVARMVGMSQPTFSRRLLNGSAFTLPEVLAICAALGISLRALLEDADAKRPQLMARGALVAGAGFEPATSGLRAWDRPEAASPAFIGVRGVIEDHQPGALIIPFPRTVPNLAVAS